MRKALFVVILIAAPVLLVAAIQRPSILRISASSPAPGASTQTAPFTRIFRAPAALLETGLQLPDLITNMAFDSDGNLWLTSAEGGPYIYSVSTNELTNMIFPETVYGLFAGRKGVWVLTSQKASLYEGTEIRRNVYFPKGVVPISGTEDEDSVFFGTTEGLFVTSTQDQYARSTGASQYISSVATHESGLLLTTSNGLEILKKNGFQRSRSFIPAAYMPRKGIFSSIVSSGEGIFAATEQDGILHIQEGGWKRIRFARQNLNLNSINAAILYRNEPWFGTLDGSLIVRSELAWHWIRVSDFPVTAIATDGSSLYAWAGGKLVQVLYDRKKEIQ